MIYSAVTAVLDTRHTETIIHIYYVCTIYVCMYVQYMYNHYVCTTYLCYVQYGYK